MDETSQPLSAPVMIDDGKTKPWQINEINGRENGPDLSRASRREVQLYNSQLHLTDSEPSL